MSMTDEQIVKALKTLDDVLALIKWQQAEIEKLNKVKVFNFTVSGTKEIMPILFCHEKELKNEAVKEFAERILNLFPSDKNYTTISRFAVKQITKELTEKEGTNNA